MTRNNTRLLDSLFGGENQNYNANAARALGGIGCAVFVQYLWRWQSGTSDGWCWRTEAEIEHDTAITPKMLVRIRERLRVAGILQEQRRNTPARMYYHLNADAIVAMLSGDEQVATKGQNLSRPKVRTCGDQRAELFTRKGPVNDSGTPIGDTTHTGVDEDELTKSRERKAVFDSYATACSFTTATERNRQHTAAAADLTQLQTDGDLPEPALMRMATEYVIRVWRSAGITRRPSFSQVVDALTEFTEWQTAWNRAGMPLDPQGNPDYMLLRRQVDPKPTAPTKTNVIRNVWAEKVKAAESAQMVDVMEGEYR